MPRRSTTDVERLLAEEPFVRALARQLVVDDADEVVQETWLHALRQGGTGVEQPRRWLARIARNVAANLRRGERRRRERQRAASVHELVPSSAELAEREERRRALVAAVDALPPPLRTVVFLRWFDGLPPRRIAAELGVPVATVWAQLNRALHLLRERLDAEHGGQRRAWLLPLVPFAARPNGLPLTPVLLTGAIAMMTKTKITAAAAVLLGVAGAWMLWHGGSAPASVPSAAVPESAPGVVQADLRPSEGPAAEAARRVAVAAPAAATTGDLVVRARYGDDQAAASGLMMTLYQPGNDPRFDAWRRRTDDTGTARFEKLAPGRLYVACNFQSSKQVDIEAGRTSKIDYVLEVGLTLIGIVVDPAGLPVAGATVEVTEAATDSAYPEVVAVTGADGRFQVRTAPRFCLVGARAGGHTASAVTFLLGKEGNAAEVRLVLGKSGGSVDGLVVDASGTPARHAVVIIGKGQLWSGGHDRIPPWPALARSDEAGRFRAIGIPAGTQPVQVRAKGFAPWLGSCEIVAGVTAPLRIVLGAGATLRGIVRNADGSTVNGARVEVGTRDTLAHYRTRSAADGSFELIGLAPGDLVIRATHSDFGRAEQRLRTEAGAAASCNLKLSRGLELVGRVVDGDGKPVARARIECLADGGGDWIARVEADAEGRFAAPNCPETGTVKVTAHAQRFEQLQRAGIDPRAGEVVLQLRAALPRSVRITGTVIGPDGKPVANATVSAMPQSARESPWLESTDGAGRFEHGPLSPGAWRVRVSSSQHGDFLSDARELPAEATWNLGTITLPLGGTAVVHSIGEIPGVRFTVSDSAESRAWQIGEEGGRLRSSVLAPGDYRLLVCGKGVAAQTIPFTIRSGQETVVEVRPQLGITARFEIVLPPASTATDIVVVRVKRGGEAVGCTWAPVHPGKPSVAEIWLSLGDYTAEATQGALHGSATFTVGAAAGQPVRIELR